MTTETAVAVRATEPTMTPFEVMERVIGSGDLSKMTPQDRIAFYWRTCESIGLNPLSRPFEFITLSGKLTMYAKRDATDQLRRIHRVSIDNLSQVVLDDILTVTATGHTPDGRTDQDVGSVSLKGLSGDARANATKKAITQAKRRLTLSLVGLGFLDESEVEGGSADVDPTTGEIIAKAPPATLLESVNRQRAKMAEATDAQPAEEAAADADPPALAESDAGAPDTVVAAPWEAADDGDVDLVEQLRSNAAASGLQGPAQKPAKDALAALFHELDWPTEILPGLTTVFGPEATTSLTAAQAQALVNLSASMGAEAFLAAWRAL